MVEKNDNTLYENRSNTEQEGYADINNNVEIDSNIITESSNANSPFISCVFSFVMHIEHMPHFALFAMKILYNLLIDFTHNNPHIEYRFYTNDKTLSNLIHAISTNNTLFSEPSDCILDIFLQARPKDILDLSDSISLNLPFCSYFSFKNLTLLDTSQYNTESTFHILQDNDIAVIPNIPNISALASMLSLDSDTCKDIFDYISFNPPIESRDLLKQEIINLADSLHKDGSMTLRYNNNIYTLSLHKDSKESYVLFSDLYNAQSFLRLDDYEKMSLASLEKPFIRVRSKDVFIKHFSNHSCIIFANLSNDLLLLLLFAYLRSIGSQTCYLFYSINHNRVLLDYAGHYPYISPYNNTFVVANNANASNPIAKLSFARSCASLMDIFASNESSNNRFCIYLSSRANTRFLIEERGDSTPLYKEIIHISLSLDILKHLKDIQDYENGDKLLKNFAKEHIELAKSWGLDSINTRYIDKESHNLLDIFDIIGRMFHIDNVLELANRCLRDRGPRIDYKLLRNGEHIGIDYARIIRSFISFYLAGVEKELLCYGLLDSMADFIGTLCLDMQINYSINEVFVCGDLLLQKPFLDRLIKAIPKNIILHLPKQGSIDIA